MLPKAVKRRVHALKRLQEQCAHIEAKFYEEVHELERKYATLYQPLFEKVISNHQHTWHFDILNAWEQIDSIVIQYKRMSYLHQWNVVSSNWSEVSDITYLVLNDNCLNE